MVDAAELARRQLVRRARAGAAMTSTSKSPSPSPSSANTGRSSRSSSSASRWSRPIRPHRTPRRGPAARAPTARGSRRRGPAASPWVDYTFPGRYISFHGNYIGRRRDILLTAVAPAAWGSTYLVTERLLPPGPPALRAAMRALPTGLVLLAVTPPAPARRLVVAGGRCSACCNIGMFFPLIFLAAYQLPGGLAATLQATSPLAVMALAWLAIGERPGTVRIAGRARRPGRRRRCWCCARPATSTRSAWSPRSARCWSPPSASC